MQDQHTYISGNTLGTHDRRNNGRCRTTLVLRVADVGVVANVVVPDVVAHFVVLVVVPHVVVIVVLVQYKSLINITGQ